MARIRYMRISGDLLVEMFKTDHTIHATVVEGLPADAKFLRAGLTTYGVVNLIVESTAFDDIADFDEIPEQRIVLYKEQS